MHLYRFHRLWFLVIHLMTPVKQSIGGGEIDCTPFETILDCSKTYGTACFLPMGRIHSRSRFSCHCVPYVCLHLAENTTFASYRILQKSSVFAVRAMRVLLFYWSILACIHCTFSINSMNSRCLHSYRFSLSRIKFLVADWIGLFLLSCFSSSFPYMFYRLMRPLSKVETRGGSLPFFYFVSFLLLCLRYFPLPLLFLWLLECTMLAFVVVVFVLSQSTCYITYFTTDFKLSKRLRQFPNIKLERR